MEKNIKSKKPVDNNRLFKETKEDIRGPIPTCIDADVIPKECPNPDCRSINIRRKGKQPFRRTILHADNGQLKRVIWLRQRCECRDCGTTFYPSSLNNNAPFTSEAVDTIVRSVLEHPEVSVNSVANSIEKQTNIGSSSAINRLIKKRIKEISDVVQPIPCTKLFYIPFKYKKNQNCCAIVGLNSTEKKMYLLDILKDGSSTEMADFFEKIDHFKNKARLFLADMNRDLLDAIEKLHGGKIGVLRGLVFWRIDACRDKHFALDRKYEALEALKKVVYTDLKEKYYYESLENWKRRYLDSDADLSKQLISLYNEIHSFRRECYIGTLHRPWEPEFSMVLSTIKICERNNSSFDFMAFRLLYANRAATGTLDGNKITQYVQNIHFPVDGPIRAFGVDIKELYNEIQDEEYRLKQMQT